jgi:hypothetical protein
VDEGGWLACDDPREMLSWLTDRAEARGGRQAGVPRDRKLRLWACACLRLCWDKLPSESRSAVEFIEAFVEGADGEPWETQKELAGGAWRKAGSPWEHPTGSAYDLFWGASNLPRSIQRVSEGVQEHGAGEAAQLRLLREVIGNPFEGVRLPASWRAEEVRSLAEAAYERRSLPEGTLDGACLGVLADALEEAGAEAALLEHLRSPGPHVRGCWAVDAVLARS